MAEFFFNNGSLTGETLLNQFVKVVLSCEAIGSQILGLVLDAGGNNSNFINLLRHTNKLTKASWLNDEECFIQNPRYPTHRIYFWFCMTHLFKAVRNQLYASKPGGAKAFEDKNDVPFGWAPIPELYRSLQSEAHADKNAHNLNTMTEQVSYSLREKTMSVPLE